MIDIEQLCAKAGETDAWDDNDAAYYALGCLKPNYPMPAIYTAVNFCLDGIEIKDTEMAKDGEYIFLPYR